MAEMHKRLNRDALPGDAAIDTYQILDSCRNQECVENVRLMVSCEDQKIIDCANSLRIKGLEAVHVGIQSAPLPFERGYRRIGLRYYVRCVLCCCTGKGIGQDVAGLCVFDKDVVLYGGEGGATVFRSDLNEEDSCCGEVEAISRQRGLPRVVVEVAEPVPLRLNVTSFDPCARFGTDLCTGGEVPDCVSSFFSGEWLSPTVGQKQCYVSLGLFSIIHFERPSRLVIPACDCCIPSKTGECETEPVDPCALFRSMEFPLNAFCPQGEGDCHR